MAINNRQLDASEQKKNFSWSSNGNLATGATIQLCIVPWPCQFVGAQLTAFGLSGAPNYTIAVNRFIVGTGFTTWELAHGTSNVAQAFGTSGYAGGSGMVTVLTGTSALSAGVTLANLQAGDVLTVTSGVANAAATVTIGYVLQPTVDVKSNFGVGL